MAVLIPCPFILICPLNLFELVTIRLDGHISLFMSYAFLYKLDLIVMLYATLLFSCVPLFFYGD